MMHLILRKKVMNDFSPGDKPRIMCLFNTVHKKYL